MGREEWTGELAEIGTSMGSSLRSISSRNEHEDENIFGRHKLLSYTIVLMTTNTFYSDKKSQMKGIEGTLTTLHLLCFFFFFL